MSKLYTEKQVIYAIQVAFDVEPPCKVKDILRDLTPIQLPTWEEINEIAEEMSVGCTTSFIQGVEWLIDEIKGGDNE